MKRPSVFVLVLLLAGLSFAQTQDFTRWVNPFIGTRGHGHTFPGAVLPFGMVQLSPDTREANWDGSSGYHYSDDIIYGFSNTHLSGTGIPDGCDILFMPTNGAPEFKKVGEELFELDLASKFSHEYEKAEPGFYSVKLDRSGILAELTATKRVGLHRYTFPKSKTSFINLDLRWRDRVISSKIRIVGNNKVEGFRQSSSWAKNQIVYFVAEFSKPFKHGQPYDNGSMEVHYLPEIEGKRLASTFWFDTADGKPVLLKV